jgi:hypothetical protein
VNHEQTETESDFPQEADYELRQAAQDAVYEAEYRRWVATLSETDRQRLTIDGLLEPSVGFIGQAGQFGKIDQALLSGGVGREEGKQVPTIDANIPTDSETDQLCSLGLSATQAEAVLQWVAPRNAEAISDLAADRLARFFSLLMPTNTRHKINLSLLGARALAGVFLMNRSGTTTLSDLAQRAWMSKQLLDFHTRRLEDALGFHGIGQKRESARAIYSESARQRWAALTPEQRVARRHGARGIVGTQKATNDDQNLTSSSVL